VHLLRYDIKCTVTDWPFNTQANCSMCPPSAWIHFVTRVTRELVNLRSTAELLMLLARIVLLSCSPCVGLVDEINITYHMGLMLIQKRNSNPLHMFACSRCRMSWIW